MKNLSELNTPVIYLNNFEFIIITMLIVNSLLKQVNACHSLIHQAIDKAPDDRFNETKNNWMYNWVIYHIIETIEYYNSDDPNLFVWGRKAGIKAKEETKEEVMEKKKNITKSMLKDYVLELSDKCITKIQSYADVDLLAKDKFHWFDSILGKYLYLLRHSMFHLGELSQTLRNWDCEHILWE